MEDAPEGMDEVPEAEVMLVEVMEPLDALELRSGMRDLMSGGGMGKFVPALIPSPTGGIGMPGSAKPGNIPGDGATGTPRKGTTDMPGSFMLNGRLNGSSSFGNGSRKGSPPLTAEPLAGDSRREPLLSGSGHGFRETPPSLSAGELALLGDPMPSFSSDPTF